MLEKEIHMVKEEKETQELEIRHLKLLNSSATMQNSCSVRSLFTAQTPPVPLVSHTNQAQFYT